MDAQEKGRYFIQINILCEMRGGGESERISRVVEKCI